VTALVAEAELKALFLNAQEAKVIQLVLKELGHPQPPTPIHIDNTTIVGIINIRSSNNGCGQWKCDISGYLMVKFKNYSVSTTNLVKRT
jgi:hypothetical protein